MAITHHFKGSTDQYGYGYFAYIEDGQLVIGEDWGREGGITYRGTYRDVPYPILEDLSRHAKKLYNNITKYYSEQIALESLQKYHDELHEDDKKCIKEVTASPAGVLWKVKLTMANAKQICVLARGTSESSVIQKLFPIVPEVLTLQTLDARVIAVRSADISVAEFLEG